MFKQSHSPLKRSLMIMGLMLCCAISTTQAAWELTAFSGYGMGGQFKEEVSNQKLDLSDNSLFALALNYGEDAIPSEQFELYFSQQDTRLIGHSLNSTNSAFDLDVSYYHIGGLIQTFDQTVNPFLVGTIGGTYLDPKSSAHSGLLRPSLGLGGGIKYFPTERIGLRLEGRAMMTFASGSASFTSDSSGTTVYIEADVFFQFQANAGLVFKF